MKKSIGVLYICTGPYVLFWKDFLESFEKNFLPNIEKKYFVFTDATDIYAENDKNVNKIYIENQPWPLITLFRFSTFLKIEEVISECDYLMFSNANMICGNRVTEDEFLPRENMGEELSVTLHPGYYGMENINFPYERNPKSTAYIPWNCGKRYVIGAMYVGTSDFFIKMSKTLKKNIEEDLKNNIIAKFHDESQLNRYIIKKSSIRYLSPAFCYPDKNVLEFMPNLNYKSKIYAVSKQAKFDVKTFKGYYDKQHNKFVKAIGKFYRKANIKGRILKVWDTFTFRNIGEIKDAE